MAPRLFGGSKPSPSSKTKPADAVERPSALLKRSAIPLPPSKTTPSPALQPSALPKGTSKASAKSPPSAPPATRSPAFAPGMSAAKPPLKKAVSAPSAIPTLPQTVGARTEIGSTPEPRARLRRKQSGQDQRMQFARSETSDLSREQRPAPSMLQDSDWEITDPHPGTLLGIGRSRPVSESPSFQSISATSLPNEATSASRMNIYNARQQLPKLSTPDPPTDVAGRSSTSSTRFSESPGNFSRGSTPTSASSHSPSMLQTPKFGPRIRPSVSPANSRPPVTRRKPGTPKNEEPPVNQGLPAVRESRASSSSPSTKVPDPAERAESEVVKKQKRGMPPPTPPLRISSKKGNNPRSIASVTSPSTSVASPAPKSTAPSPSVPTTPATSAPTAPAASTSADVREGSHPPPTSRITAPAQASKRASGIVQPKQILTREQPAVPPPRPSREGLLSLETQLLSPVIQSNLSHIATTGRTRRESMSKIATPASAPASARPSISRSASITSATSQSGLTATAGGPSMTSPHLFPRNESKTYPPTSIRADLHTTTKRDPSPITAPSRFSLFSRRLKSPSETSVASPPPAKLTKKGPAAGTGHEGYGRYARRGRSTSAGTAGSRGKSTSTDRSGSVAPRPSTSRKSSFNSNESKPELDEFFRDRLEPITIGGGGYVRENRNSKTSLYETGSAQSSVGSFESGIYTTSGAPSRQQTPSVDHGSLASSQNVSRELLPAPRFVSTPQGITQQERTIAHRRSLHRSQISGEDELRMPPPINTRFKASSPGMETYDSTISSIPATESSMMSDRSEGQEANWLRSRKKKIPVKAKAPSRWNIFRRTQRSPERPPTRQLTESFESERAMPAQVSTAHGYGPVAHYTMMDDADSASDQELEEKLRSIEGNLNLEAEFAMQEEMERDRRPSILLPPPPQFATGYDDYDYNLPLSPRVPLNQSPGRSSGESARQPRLQHVGRIPQVISQRNRHVPASNSFSRPFAGRLYFDEPHTAPQSAMHPTTLGLRTGDLPTSGWPPYDLPASAPIPTMIPFPFHTDLEFLRMSPRKDSELTEGSSSTGLVSLAPVTAITPTPEDVLSDDEVWNEYDELLDRVSPPLPPESPGIGELLMNFPIAMGRPPLPVDYMTAAPPLPNDYQTAVPMRMSHVNTGSGKHRHAPSLRRPALPPRPERLAPPAAPGLTNEDGLASPVSLSDLYANYGNRSSAAKSNPRLSNVSATSGSRYSSQTIISESGSTYSSIDGSPQQGCPPAASKRMTQVMAAKTWHASSESLRFAALMTARWLSFDRVLVSPAQDDVSQARQSRVLVLDGLGNDDWAAYCALTYADATVYHLSTANRKLNRDAAPNSAAWIPPPNLRRTSHNGLSAPFPFPKGFFACVVLRFPAADTPTAYKHAISECKRVLKPGGFLELCILDIDMVNMGSRARRAIRTVKERMQGLLPDVSLGPASDTVIKLLGRRGFENLNRCVVGVPLAGEGVASPSSGGGPPNTLTDASTRANKHTSLQDLLEQHRLTQHTNSPAMVGRVAQWWWSRCYEAPVVRASLGSAKDLARDDGAWESTVWRDPELLRECAERQTSLRLVICYAQKPESVRRRTVSV